MKLPEKNRMAMSLLLQAKSTWGLSDLLRGTMVRALGSLFAK